jgi:hypothetical protein
MEEEAIMQVEVLHVFLGSTEQDNQPMQDFMDQFSSDMYNLCITFLKHIQAGSNCPLDLYLALVCFVMEVLFKSLVAF